MGRVKPLPEDFPDKHFRLETQEVRLTPGYDDNFGAGLFEEAQFFIRQRKTSRGPVGADDGQRMRLKGQHDEWGNASDGEQAGLRQYLLMGAMHAVEIADRKNGAGKRRIDRW